ncbi:MAG: ParB N-terminal domain-containing protein [Christensenellales bacterium]
MQATIESIKTYGVLVPAIVRPRKEGGYEIIAGHRRKYACEQAGLETMPVSCVIWTIMKPPSLWWTVTCNGKTSCQANGCRRTR